MFTEVIAGIATEFVVAVAAEVLAEAASGLGYYL